MLSYQHAYHAGNRADVHKHAMLAALLVALTQKDRGITYIETHAGRGLYDLASPESHKTGEAKDGIISLINTPFLPEDHPYMQTLHAIRKTHGASAYPGSPAIAQHLLRPQDTLHLFELHPQEHLHLKQTITGKNVHIHHADGYTGTLAKVPTQLTRGLVLIDPSFEIKSEYESVVEFIIQLHAAWPQTVIALWYPMLKARLHEAMVESLLSKDWPSHHDEHTFADPQVVRGLYGSGMVLINPPYQFSKN